MNGKLVLFLSLSVALLVASQLSFSQATDDSNNVATLRGGAIQEVSQTPETSRWQPDREPVPRNYVQQPPVIPHAITGYSINLKFNKCLTCHSWANYKNARATKISQEHFKDRDGIAQANVSASRYFCTQCHVAQKNVKPLVVNDFKGVDILESK